MLNRGGGADVGGGGGLIAYLVTEHSHSPSTCKDLFHFSRVLIRPAWRVI